MKKVFLLFLVSFLMIFTKSSFAKEIVGPGGTSSGYKPEFQKDIYLLLTTYSRAY